MLNSSDILRPMRPIAQEIAEKLAVPIVSRAQAKDVAEYYLMPGDERIKELATELYETFRKISR